MKKLNPKIHVPEWLYRMAPYSNMVCGAVLAVVANHWLQGVIGFYGFASGVVVYLARGAPKQFHW